MFNRKSKSEYRTAVECQTTFPSDCLWESDTQIRPDGLGITDALAIYLVKKGLLIGDIRADNEHNCWVLDVRWKNKSFEFWVYNFHDVIIRLDLSKGSHTYIELLLLLEDFLVHDTRFSELQWSRMGEAKEMTRYSTPMNDEVNI